MSGCALAFKAMGSPVEILAVEAARANRFYQSQKARKSVTLHSCETIADGLRVKKLGNLNWQIMRNTVDEALQVSEEAIVRAMAVLEDALAMRVEPAAAASLAALLQRSMAAAGDALCVLSGGNVDSDTFSILTSSQQEGKSDRTMLEARF